MGYCSYPFMALVQFLYTFCGNFMFSLYAVGCTGWLSVCFFIISYALCQRFI